MFAMAHWGKTLSDARPMTDRVQSLSTRYSQEAEAYRKLWAPVLFAMTRTHLDSLCVEGACRVLDIGTGTGSALPDLRRRFPEAQVFGVDRAVGMLGAVGCDVPLACMDASRLALAARSFDLVLLSFMLFHLPDPGMGLREVRRVLRDGGTVALSTWAGDAECVATQIWSEELDACGATPAAELEHLARHELMDSPAKVESLLRAAGFGEPVVQRRTFEYPMTGDTMLQLKMHLGRSRRRLESLNARARSQCIARARQRFATLRVDDITLRMPVILATARTAC